MKRLIALSVLFLSLSVVKAGNLTPVKPMPKSRPSMATMKLAEAKAILSKANTRNLKNNLGVADGGI
jgi:hypothetical protein